MTISTFLDSKLDYLKLHDPWRSLKIYDVMNCFKNTCRYVVNNRNEHFLLILISHSGASSCTNTKYTDDNALFPLNLRIFIQS